MAGRTPLRLVAALIASVTATSVSAQSPTPNWPNGPVKMFVGFAAGGSTDIIARDIGQEQRQGNERRNQSTIDVAQDRKIDDVSRSSAQSRENHPVPELRA